MEHILVRPFMAHSGNAHLDTAYPEAVTGNKIHSYYLYRLDGTENHGNFTEPLVSCPVLLWGYIQPTGNVFPRFSCPSRTW